MKNKNFSKWLLLLVLILGAAMRIWFVANDMGAHWPDEFHQSFEPAYYLLHGYGNLPWEYQLGARTWVFPGIVAIPFGIGELLFSNDPAMQLLIVRGMFVLLSLLTVLLIYRFSRGFGAGEMAAVLVAGSFAIGSLPIYFAHRPMAETLSGLVILAGFWLALQKNIPKLHRLFGVALVCFSCFLKIHNGLFVVTLLLLLLVRREWQLAWRALWVSLVGLIAYGLVDWLAWGELFHSANTYLYYHVTNDLASSFGTESFGFFFRTLYTSWGYPVIILTVCCCFLAGTWFWSALLLFLMLLLFSKIPHKELRFILPLVPLWLGLSGIGLQRLFDHLQRFGKRGLYGQRGVVVIFLLALAASYAHTPYLTFGEIGQANRKPANLRAIDLLGAVNRLMIRAHQEEPLCGLLLDRFSGVFVGAHSHLQKKVPIVDIRWSKLPADQEIYNYVITKYPSDYASIGNIVATDQEFSLIALSRTTCRISDNYRWLTL